jgi:hypothetical protein
MLLLPGWAQARKNLPNALQFVIPVLPEAERYLDLLAYPPYLAVALENNGITPSNLTRVTVVDAHTVQFRNAFLRFSEKKGPLFIYQGKMELEIANVKTGFNLRTEVDISEIKKGTVTIRIYTPLAGLLPKPLVDKIEIKIQSLAGEAVQKKMLAYLDDLEKRRPQGSGIAGTLELILIQGYNTSSSARLGEGREPGDAEPFSDQILFLATLAIWFIVVPLAALSFYLWRRFKHRRLESPHTDG